VRWRDIGNSCKKEFFRALKSRHSKARITELAAPHGAQTSDPEEVIQLCHDFYKDLFSEPAPSHAVDPQTLDILERIPKIVTPEMNAKLCAPIELTELEQAVRAMANKKAPGPDGV
jgi:hypothetical protein